MAAAPKDLLESIDWSMTECLNCKGDPGNALKQGYREQDELYLETDADEQLLLNIHFKNKVKLQSICIKGPEDAGPRIVKLFANRSSLGFSDVQGNTPATQEIVLTPQQVSAGEAIPLKMVKFNFVSAVSIFIESNQTDEETTRISKIALLGQSGEVFDVSQIKKAGEDQ